MGNAVVESARGAVAALLPLRFPGPLAEPGVRVSPLCRIRHSGEYAGPSSMDAVRLGYDVGTGWESSCHGSDNG